MSPGFNPNPQQDNPRSDIPDRPDSKVHEPKPEQDHDPMKPGQGSRIWPERPRFTDTGKTYCSADYDNA